MDKNMAMEHINGQQEINILEVSVKIREKDQVFINGFKEGITRESGAQIV